MDVGDPEFVQTELRHESDSSYMEYLDNRYMWFSDWFDHKKQVLGQFLLEILISNTPLWSNHLGFHTNMDNW